MRHLLPLLLVSTVVVAADPLPDGVAMRLGTASGIVDSAAAVSHDGKRLATVQKGGSVGVWDLTTGRLLYTHPKPANRVEELAWTPDGKLFGSAVFRTNGLILIGWAGEKDGALTEKAWDELHETAKLADPDAPRVHRYALARDGRRVAVLSNGQSGRVAVYRVTPNTSTHLLDPELDIPLPGGEVVGFSDDGSTLFTVRPSAKDGDRVAAYDLTSKTPGKPAWVLELPRVADREEVRDGKQVTVVVKGWPRGGRSKDGKRVVLEYPDPQGLMEVWDGPTGKKLHAWAFPPHHSEKACVDFSPDGRRLAISVREKGGLMGGAVYDLDSGKEATKLTAGPCDPGADALRYTPDGKRLLRGCLVWDAETGKDLTPTGLGHHGHVTAVLVSGDGKTIVTSGTDHTARGWDAKTGEEKWRAVFPEVAWQLTRLDGDTAVATPSSFESATLPQPLLNLNTGKLSPLPGDMAKERKVKVGKETRTVHVLPVAVSPDGKTAVSVDQSKPALEMWDWKTGERRKVLPFDPPAKMKLDVIRDLAFSADGKELVGVFFYNLINPKPTSGVDVMIKAHDQVCLERWSIADGVQLERVSYQKFTIATLAANGTRSVVIRPDKVSDLETGEKLLAPKEKEGWVFETTRFYAALSPDGNTLAIRAHKEGKEFGIRWYDLKSRKLLAARPVEATEFAFLPDGQLVSAGESVFVWKAAK